VGRHHSQNGVAASLGMNMGCSQRDEGLSGSTLGHDHGGPLLLPPFHHSHQGDGLCGKWLAQKSFDAGRYGVIKLMQRGKLRKDTISQEIEVRPHICCDVSYVVMLHETPFPCADLSTDDHITYTLS
jgi:hypothetical protein